MTQPRHIPGFFRTHDRPVEIKMPSAQESAEFLRRHRDKQGRAALAFMRDEQNAKLNATIRSKTRDSTPLGTFLGNEQKSEFKPTPPPTGHREGFEGSVQCGCKACTARRKKTRDNRPAIKSIADLNAANRAAYAVR